MSTLALLNCASYIGGHDFTGDSSQANLNMEVTQLNKTTFRSNGWTELAGGLKDSTFDLQGFFSAGTDAPDPESFSNLGVRKRVHTLSPSESETGVSYLWQGGFFTYSLLGSINEMAPFTLQSRGSDGVGVVRGQLAAAPQDVSAIGAFGSGVNLGAGGTGKFLYATLHTFTAGTSLDVEIQSDDSSSFGTPTSVASFSTISAEGGSWLARVDASAITDTWFRFNVTANTGTFNVAGSIAIQ